MSAWDLTRRDAAQPAGSRPRPAAELAIQPPPVSYWHDQLLALLGGGASGAGPQAPLNLEAANLVQSMPLLLLADKQSLARLGARQSLVDSLAGLCSRSLTPSPSTSSSHSNSVEAGPEVGPPPRQQPLLMEPSAPTADSTFCSSLSSCSSGGSSCGDLSQSALAASTTQAGQLPDRKARKKDQNRRAAFNYRRKKMEERDKMVEEEAKLVHRHVRLAGKIARLEDKIITMLSSRTTRILDSVGKPNGHLCPTCFKPCDNIAALRTHLKTRHFQEMMPQLDRTEALATATAATVSKSQTQARAQARRERVTKPCFKETGCKPALYD